MKYEALIFSKKNNIASFISKIEDKYYGYSITNNGIDKVNQNIFGI